MEKEGTNVLWGGRLLLSHEECGRFLGPTCSTSILQAGKLRPTQKSRGTCPEVRTGSHSNSGLPVHRLQPSLSLKTTALRLTLEIKRNWHEQSSYISWTKHFLFTKPLVSSVPLLVTWKLLVLLLIQQALIKYLLGQNTDVGARNMVLTS